MEAVRASPVQIVDVYECTNVHVFLFFHKKLRSEAGRQFVSPWGHFAARSFVCVSFVKRAPKSPTHPR